MATSLTSRGKVESDGSSSVTLQDQTTPPLISRFSKERLETTTTAATVIGARTIAVTAVTAVVVGDQILIVDAPNLKYYVGQVTNIATLVVTVDNIFSEILDSGVPVHFGIINLNVDGDPTPEVFSLRGNTTPVTNSISFDVTRLIFQIQCDGVADLATFGDIAALTYGCLLRKKLANDTYQNIFNVKTNGELAGICYDLTIHAATNPQQGEDGVLARITFGGASKIGVVIRINPGEDLEFVIQDDIDALLSFVVTAEGHVAIP